ncbi:hypothetical protein [Mesobacillus foraminis]|uniref:hypothetical protein n=1 Tax=Mesobacillus foraminis TaxID=279826 RepID=UPI0013CEFC16|nr:hypothetical protein [Mesobacillus foraminis]
MAVARSRSGRIEGPWIHEDQLLMDRNAGHSSLFTGLDGRTYLATHYPDTPHGSERPLFLPIEETADGLRIK